MTKDKLIANILQRMALRSENGIKKFGLTMGETKKPTVAWIDDAQEELWDAIVYLEKCIEDETYREKLNKEIG